MDTKYLNHHQSPMPKLWHFDLELRIMVYMVDVINIAWKKGFLKIQPNRTSSIFFSFKHSYFASFVLCVLTFGKLLHYHIKHHCTPTINVQLFFFILSLFLFQKKIQAEKYVCNIYIFFLFGFFSLKMLSILYQSSFDITCLIQT